MDLSADLELKNFRFRLLAPGTINVRLAAVRRLAYEAADTGLLSWPHTISEGPALAGCKQRLREAVNDRIGIEPC